MLFNSFLFLYLFLPITYVGFWRLRGRRERHVWLTLASYVFYGYWNYKFCAVMAFSTGVSYLAGLGLRRWQDPRHRRLCLILPISIDLMLLAGFKYTNFFLDTLQTALRHFSSPVTMPSLDIILPIGISFYTFHTISYIIDSYRGDVEPTDDFWEFACYVSLFSQLVAGPIVRFRQVESDLRHLGDGPRAVQRDKGWSLFVLGLAKKVLIADTIATVINPAWSHAAGLSTVSAWLCVLGYTYQLYFDFSGYSDMAVGLGYLFGIRLPQNFNSPYIADGIADFWRRWHISLSSCLRDYLYIPLGGSRGTAGFVARNLMITMLIGGLWHGANWTFVFWGGYHGALLIAARVWSATTGPRLARSSAWPRRMRQGWTFLLVSIGWVFFRAPTLGAAVALLRKMVVPQHGDAIVGSGVLVVVLALAAAAAHSGPNTFEMRHDWSPRMVSVLTLLFIGCLVAMYGAHASPFLYFQF